MKLKANFTILIGVATVLVFSGFAFISNPKENKQVKPNIIFVLVDDLGYGDVGFTGQKYIKTPNIDRLALEGKVFINSYTGSTVCGPSRTSLILGKHPGHSPIRGNPAWTSSGKPANFALSDITIAEELKRASYTTGVIGKWGFGQDGKTSFPLKQGFDYFYGFADHTTAHHHYPDKIWDNNKEVSIAGNTPYGKNGVYIQDEFTRKAKEFISSNSKKPFFLYLNWTIPHTPLIVPEDSKKPYSGLGWKDSDVAYAGMVSRMDRDIGDIMLLLKQLNIDDNTLVIFTSDNGPEYAERSGNFFNSNGPFQGFKRDLYEGGIRSPFVARWPLKIQPGTRSDHPIAFWDFLPTICELAGIEPSDKAIDGVSYLPSLLGNIAGQKQSEYFYWEINENEGPIQAIRKGNWKAIKFYQKPVALYDLSQDLAEKNNVAADHPEIVQEMLQLLVSARSENSEFPLVPKMRTSKVK